MGGPERNKYQKREEQRKQAEADQNNSRRDPATLQLIQSVRASQNQPPSQLGAGSDYVTRGNLQHLGSRQSGYNFSGYGPGGPRSESGSSMSSGSSIFGAGGSIGGQFDGPKDARPSNVNVGNLELGARIWFATRGVSLSQPQPISCHNSHPHSTHPFMLHPPPPSRFEMARLVRRRICPMRRPEYSPSSSASTFHKRRASHSSVFSFLVHQLPTQASYHCPSPLHTHCPSSSSFYLFIHCYSYLHHSFIHTTSTPSTMAPKTQFESFRNFDVITNPPKGQIPDAMPPRPAKLNNLGKECNIGLNTYHVTQFPNKPVYQYDVTVIGNSCDKRMVINKVWNSKTIKSKLDPSWIFDGNKLAW